MIGSFAYQLVVRLFEVGVSMVEAVGWRRPSNDAVTFHVRPGRIRDLDAALLSTRLVFGLTEFHVLLLTTEHKVKWAILHWLKEQCTLQRR